MWCVYGEVDCAINDELTMFTETADGRRRIHKDCYESDDVNASAVMLKKAR